VKLFSNLDIKMDEFCVNEYNPTDVLESKILQTSFKIPS
jgi:hypothetical protein